MPSREIDRIPRRKACRTESTPVFTLTLLALTLLVLAPVWGCASSADQEPVAGAEMASQAGGDKAMDEPMDEPMEEPKSEPMETATAESDESQEDEPQEDESKALGGGTFGRVGTPETTRSADEEDQEWLVDEQGRRYYVLPVPKSEIRVWRHLGDNRVRIPLGQVLELANEDEDFFYVKRYDTQGISTRRFNTPPSDEELEAVAARYRVESPETDRLRFEPAAQGLPEQGQWRNGFVLADMNGDGHLDIVHGPPRKSAGSPWIFLGDSQGHWRRWSEVSFPAAGFDYGDVAVADFNRDEIPDLAVTSHQRGAMVLVGDGKGRFEPWSEGIGFKKAQDKKHVFTSRTMDVVDWNEDGWMDLLLVGEGPRLAISRGEDKADFSMGSSYGAAIYLNQGDGTWSLVRQSSQFGDAYGDSVTLGDFDGDGRTDFVIGSNVMNNKAILNLAQGDGSWWAKSIEALRDKAYIRAVRAAKIDADDRTDLVVAYMSFELAKWRTGIDVLLARPNGEWDRRTVAMEESRDGVYALDTGDLDGDGHTDVVGLTGLGAVWVNLGDGQGGFHRELSPEVPPEAGGCRGYHVALVDFDDDGRDEVVAGFAGESTIVQMDECPSGGALRAWDPRPQQASAALTEPTESTEMRPADR